MLFKNMFLVITVSLSLILLLINGIECKASVTVSARQFNGLSKTIDGKQVNLFLGIPYAKPPVGDLRFKKPVPLNNFDKPIDATLWPNACMQRVIPEQLFLYQNKNFSEDCLYLNIWTPIINTTDAALKPVLFWIHGGALVAGSSNVFFTSGETLAIKGDVVVVSINYRLDHFGFLYLGTDDAPGNVGLWDQALALKWVNDNIEYFGGDRERITIFGASAGGWSVSLHLISPITRNLFKNAVVMSGSAHSVFTRYSRDAVNTTLNIASKHNCNVDSVKKAVECLRRISANDLIADSIFNVEKVIDYRLLYGDEFIPENPLEMLKKGDFKRNANVLLGTTDDEGSLLMSWFYNYTAYEESTKIVQSKSEAINELENVLKKFGEIKNAAKSADKLYISNLPESNYGLIRRSIVTAIGDYVITCPVTHLAKTLFNYNKFAANSNGSNGKIYQYVFSASKKENSWRGSDHYSDVAYWFGNVPQSTSTKMIDILSSFAYNGKPSPQEGIEWPNYYAINNRLVTPYYRITPRPNLNETNYGYGYKPECDYIWNKYIEE